MKDPLKELAIYQCARAAALVSKGVTVNAVVLAEGKGQLHLPPLSEQVISPRAMAFAIVCSIGAHYEFHADNHEHEFDNISERETILHLCLSDLGAAGPLDRIDEQANWTTSIDEEASAFISDNLNRIDSLAELLMQRRCLTGDDVKAHLADGHGRKGE